MLTAAIPGTFESKASNFLNNLFMLFMGGDGGDGGSDSSGSDSGSSNDDVSFTESETYGDVAEQTEDGSFDYDGDD